MRNYMTVCKALEPVVSVKQKVCLQIHISSVSILSHHLILSLIATNCFLMQDEISRVLVRILQACGKATEFLSSIVMEEVKNLGKV